MTDRNDKRPFDRRVVFGLAAVCLALLAIDLVYHKHPKFTFEALFGFYAFYGLLAAVVVTLASKLLQRLVMRREDYYDGDDG